MIDDMTYIPLTEFESEYKKIAAHQKREKEINKIVDRALIRADARDCIEAITLDENEEYESERINPLAEIGKSILSLLIVCAGLAVLVCFIVFLMPIW